MRTLKLALGATFLSIGALAAPITYVTSMSGPQEDPPNASPGTGQAIVTIDTDTHILEVFATFSGLLGPTTAAHIHAPTAVPFAGNVGVATMVPSFLNFPLGVTEGTMPSTTFDLTLASSFRPGFITDQGGTPADAEAALAEFLAEGRAYFNIHTTSFPGGEIRGFLQPIPEPATVFLVAGAMIGSFLVRRRRA